MGKIDYTAHIFDRLQEGESLEKIGKELTDALNKATDLYIEQKKAREEEKKKEHEKYKAAEDLLSALDRMFALYDIDIPKATTLNITDIMNIFDECAPTFSEIAKTAAEIASESKKSCEKKPFCKIKQ